MPHRLQAGEVLATRYRLDDLLTEHESGRFWRGWDQLLSRPVAVHVVPADHPHAERMLEAARGSAGLHDRRVLRVLDAAEHDGVVYVVNEWGQGASLDIMLRSDGPLQPRQAAYVVAEVADSVAAAHEAGLSHGRLVPEHVLVDRNGDIRLIGFAVDAALHGLPPDRRSADVADLAALLYAALTGRWAGQSRSDVPPAPQEGGAVLRPRQVRAGIPRPLDSLCDEVLNPHVPHHAPRARAGRPAPDRTTARGIADELAEFVGDPTGLVLTVPDLPGPATATGPAALADPTTQVPAADEEPTRAGLPVFHEDDDVSWVDSPTAREEPAPPPPFEPEPERPLFAPDPPEGRPARRPRREAGEAPEREVSGREVPGPTAAAWPWGDTGAGAAAGGGARAAYSHGWDTAATGELDEVPGRSWLRLAMVVGLCALVLVAAVAAFQLGGGDLGLPPDEEPTTSAASPSPPPEPTPFTGLEASAFDPQGDPPGMENPESVPLALDGDPTTAWRTSTYFDQLGPPPGLKTGVGITVDLGQVRDVRRVEVSVLGGPTTFELYVTEEPPTTVEGLEPAAEAQTEGTDGTARLELDPPVTGRYVTVWLTELPPVGDDFRGEIAEIVVAG